MVLYPGTLVALSLVGSPLQRTRDLVRQGLLRRPLRRGRFDARSEGEAGAFLAMLAGEDKIRICQVQWGSAA